MSTRSMPRRSVLRSALAVLTGSLLARRAEGVAARDANEATQLVLVRAAARSTSR